ncbi:MAG: helix-turn-helix domain-containing protein, partial [Cyclobacteriaceae bacterium]
VLQSLVTDSLIKLDFKLNKGFSNPYVGLSISPILEKYINAVGYNRIKLLIKGHNIDRIGLTIFNPPHVSPLEQDEIPFHTFLNISKTKKNYELPLSKFEAPEWWKDMYHVPENERLRPDLSKILRINLGSAYTVDTERLLTLEIYKVSFSRDNRSLFVWLFFGETIFIIFIFCIGYLVVYIKGRNENITVLYKPLASGTNKIPVDSYLEYINNNFDNSELTLELVSKETGVPQRQITKDIQAKFYCNFKTYINRLRINESKRFLSHSDLNMGEIAYKVGFNNQSHFNRVFKNEVGINPSEYLEKHRS